MTFLQNNQITELTTSSANFAGISDSTACFSTAHDVNWIIDSGASDHMCAHKHLFSSLIPLNPPLTVSLPNGQIITITEKGHVPLTADIILHDVLYIPYFKYNLLSVHKLAEQFKCTISFSHYNCIMQGSSQKMPRVLGKVQKGLYILPQAANSAHITSLQCVTPFVSYATCNNV